jgi:hypothetical protein
MKYILLTLLSLVFTNPSIAQFTNSQKQYFASENILSNPGIESGKVDWTLTAGTYAKESTIKVAGAYSAKLTLSSQTLAFYQDSTSYASQFAGTVQGLAYARVKTTVSGIFVCARQAGATVLTNCAPVDNSGTWGLYKVPFVLGATSNGIAIVSGTVSSGLVTVGNVTGDVYVDDTSVSVGNITDTGAPSMESMTAAVAFGSMLDVTAELRFPTTSPFTVSGDSSLITYTDDSGNTRTKFVAAKPVYITAFMSGSITTTNSFVQIRVNGTAVGTGSHIRTAGDNSTATWTGKLNTGDYLTYDAGTAINSGTIYAAITATAVAASNTYTAPINSRSTYRVDTSNGYGSGSTMIPRFTNVRSNTLTGATCTDSSTLGLTCTVTEPAMYSIQHCNAYSAGAGWLGISLNSASLTTAVQSLTQAELLAMEYSKGGTETQCPTWTGMLATGDVVRPHMNSATISSALSSWTMSKIGGNTIYGNFKDVIIAPNTGVLKTCYYAFGGASATLASPTECTTGTCVEVYDSCNAGSAPTWASTSVYNNLTFANGTWANTTPVHCSCGAYDTVAASIRECDLYFDTSDQSWASTSSGGMVLNLYAKTGPAVENTTYINVKCEGVAP